MTDPRLAAARLWAANELPYFAAGLFALAPVAAPGLGTLAVDRRWRLYVDPAVLDEWSVPQVGAVLVHELCHVLREHPERGDELGVGDANATAWNVACDAEINDDLVDIGLPLPDPIVPSSIGAATGQLAEAYYALLPERRAGADCAVDCGSGAHGHARPWEVEVPGGPTGLDRAAADGVRRRVALDVAAAHAAGTVPKGLARWADDLVSPRFDWRRALAAEVRRAVYLASGRVDYTYRRPSRRAAALPDVVLPSFASPVPAVAIVVDTSGSMDEGELGACLVQVDAIIRGVGLRATGVPVLACDARVHAVTKVVSADRVKLAGGGGTDMGAGLAAALALSPRPEVVVVLTDGYTPWPSCAPRGTRVVVGLVGGGGREDVPAWARSVVIACT